MGKVRFLRRVGAGCIFLLFLNFPLCAIPKSVPNLSHTSSEYFPKHFLPLVFLKIPSKPIKIERLGGLVNKNYLMHFENHRHYVVKVFNSKIGGDDLRIRESHNQNLASKISLAPKMNLLSNRLGIVKYISSASELAINETSLSQFVQVVSNLHNSILQFKGTFDFSKWAQECLNICINEGKISQSEQDLIIKMIEKSHALFRSSLISIKVPCHNDLRTGNILVNESGIKLIDWEDSSMNDPAWDICYFLIASLVPDGLWFGFLKEYKQLMTRKDPKLIKRVKLYRPFVLIKIALGLKTYLTKTQQSSPKFKGIIDLCINNANSILQARNYQKLFNSFLKNEGNK